jgi:hypothetical protein
METSSSFLRPCWPGCIGLYLFRNVQSIDHVSWKSVPKVHADSVPLSAYAYRFLPLCVCPTVCSVVRQLASKQGGFSYTRMQPD